MDINNSGPPSKRLRLDGASSKDSTTSGQSGRTQKLNNLIIELSQPAVGSSHISAKLNDLEFQSLIYFLKLLKPRLRELRKISFSEGRVTEQSLLRALLIFQITLQTLTNKSNDVGLESEVIDVYIYELIQCTQVRRIEVRVYATKLLCNLLEGKLGKSFTMDETIQAFKKHEGIPGLLSLLSLAMRDIQNYALRGLSSHTRTFATRIVQAKGIYLLLAFVGQSMEQKQTVEEIKAEAGIIALATTLLANLFRLVESASQSVSTSDVESLMKIWCGVVSKVRGAPEAIADVFEKPFLDLTNILYCICRSIKTSRVIFVRNSGFELGIGLLKHFSKRISKLTIANKNGESKTIERSLERSLETSDYILRLLIIVSVDKHPACVETFGARHSILLQFLVGILSKITSYEPDPTNVDAVLAIQEFQENYELKDLDATHWIRHAATLKDLLTLLSSCMAQSKEAQKFALDTHIVYVLSTLLTTELDYDQQQKEEIFEKTLKMLLELFSEPEAIDHFGDNLRPVMEIAFKKLIATSLNTVENNSTRSASVISFRSLRFLSLACRNLRSRTILIDMDILATIKEHYIPELLSLEELNPPERAKLYTELLYLFSLDAPVRVKIREDYGILSSIIEILNKVRKLIEQKSATKLRIAGITGVGCLKIISNFFYDKYALSILSKCEPLSKLTITPADDLIFVETGKISIIPSLLHIIGHWTWSQEAADSLPTLQKSDSEEAADLTVSEESPVFSKADQILIESARLVDHLTKAPECRRYLASTPDAILDLSKTLVLSHPSSSFPHSIVAALKRIITQKDLLQQLTLNNIFTQVFQPFLKSAQLNPHNPHFTELKQSIYSVHQELRDLYRFSKHEENLVRFHEYAAVAVVYSTQPDSFTAVVISRAERFSNGDDLIDATSIFSVICKMAVFELEFEEEEDENMLTVLNGESVNRRRTGAQAIEYLAQTYGELHARQYEELLGQYQLDVESKSFKNLIAIDGDKSSATAVSDQVTFRLIHDNDAEFTVSRNLLSAVSPIFKVMLLGEYAESRQSVISLQETRSPEFALFLSIVERCQSTPEPELLELIPSSTAWVHILSLIDFADKYLLEYPKLVAEYWLLTQMATDYLPETANEIVRTYRFYAPKAIEQRERSAMLRGECIRRLAKRMTLTAFSAEFNDIIKDIDETAKLVEDIARLISDPKLANTLDYTD
ncbi:hypothetical protein K493DRAFT_372030 [Basidiobolus meristosporus CBS 931.73]|uniref:BTB domain-containing protein n=1 Tax=Basidiobolus meristosporus CBS 931.73 TaxID=1314790 RepID=A0A1Y1YC09_9FUNG|nr:hypothetical protein K493DRAFT_372030 [Basidiobolus meristosporus CBS 931.73]|eukprot:ORX95560.1 hypothetical protein K493DRAFT_372030 [Basidiobolus meristosporus CBS 931.73]